MLHHDGNGVGTQIDERTLAQLMKLRTVTRMPDADPASTSSAGRAVLRSRHAPQSRATIGAHTARILTGATLTGNACVMQSMGERVPAELMVGQGKVSNHASKGQGVCLSRTQMKYDHH